MISNVLTILNENLTLPLSIGFWVLVVIIGFFGFWKKLYAVLLKKHLFDKLEEDEPTHQTPDSRFFDYKSIKIFDFLFFTAIFALLGGRILFFILNPQRFETTRWFWLPYERFQDDLYVMQTFPWIFLNFSKGGMIWESVLFIILLMSFIGVSNLRLSMEEFILGLRSLLSTLFIGLIVYISVKEENFYLTMVFGVILLYRISIEMMKLFPRFKFRNRLNLVLESSWCFFSILGPAIFLLIYPRDVSRSYGGVLRIINISSLIIGIIIMSASFISKSGKLINTLKSKTRNPSVYNEYPLIKKILSRLSRTKLNRPSRSRIEEKGFVSNLFSGGRRSTTTANSHGSLGKSSDRKFSMSFRDIEKEKYRNKGLLSRITGDRTIFGIRSHIKNDNIRPDSTENDNKKTGPTSKNE